jgi:hypothetical protein
MSKSSRHHRDVDGWEWDTWTIERIGIDARYAHQPHRRIYFSDIEPAWLRELAKRCGALADHQRHAVARRGRRRHRCAAIVVPLAGRRARAPRHTAPAHACSA